jgi:hypothetical protein
MGTLINLFENKYKYELPECPTREEDILFYDKKKKDQYWRTPEFPERIVWNRMTTIEQFQFVDIHRGHWRDGVWFFNNGEPTYITGMHYDHLAFATFDFGKATYYDSQREDFYMRDLARKDPFCFGVDWLKPRRYGMTAEEITQQTYTAIEGSDRNLGMFSDNLDKTMNTIFNPLVASYIKRPAFIRPLIYMPNGRIPKTKLLFNNGRVDKDFEEGLMGYSGGCLNSLIQPKPTTVIGFDGWKLFYLTMDEVWKWTGASPVKCWEKQKKCLIVGGKIVGKVSILSTMGDDDDYEKSIEEGIQFWYDSDPAERDENGRTKSGVYHYFISGVHAQFEFADIYGRINADQATDYIMKERQKYPEGTKERLFEERRIPLTVEEALATANSSSIFEPKRMQHAITILEKTPKDEYPTAMYNLNELPNGKVELEPDNYGIWEFGHLPKIVGDKNYSNRWYKDGDGQHHLLPNPQGCIGYDPVRYADVDTTSNNVSMAAIIARQKFDYYDNNGANKFQALYHQRPGSSEDAHYECFKLAKLLGYPIMYERQVESFKRRMIENGAIELLLKSPTDGKHGMWTDNQRKVVKAGIDLLQTYWRAPKSLNEIDYLLATKFIALLKQAKTFNPMKTTTSDIMMADIMLEHGLLQIKEVNLSDNYLHEQNNILKVLFPKRN